MIKISFLGDISLNDKYTEMYSNGENPFVKFEQLLSDQDFVIGNLECFPKGDDGENLLKRPRLTTNYDTLNFLKNINLKIACLANNHVYDHLESGFVKARHFLESNNIKYLGAGLSEKEAAKEIIVQKNGIKVAFLNYVTEDTNPSLPLNSKLYVNIFHLGKVIKDIKDIRDKVDYVVLLLHWGGKVEGGLFPDFEQPKLARKLIDTGADLIIGHHSHTFQPFEKYKNKFIFYSLGNFAFSDYSFNNEITPLSDRRKISPVILVDFYKNEIKVDIKVFKNALNEYIPLYNYNRKMKIKNVLFTRILKIKLCWYFYFIHFRYVLPIILFYKRKDLDFKIKLVKIIKSIKKRI